MPGGCGGHSVQAFGFIGSTVSTVKAKSVIEMTDVLPLR
jgi:hypothetical protein